MFARALVRLFSRVMAAILGESIAPEICGKHRVGALRHCFADIGLAREVLGCVPAVPLEDGLEDLAVWPQDQPADDRMADASRQLAARGVTV